MGYGNTEKLERRFYVTKGTLGLDAAGEPINYVDGTFSAIYFYDDPGVPEKKIRPSKKLCVELIDPESNKRYTIIGKYDGDGGAPTWFATTVADGLEQVGAGEAVRISVMAASNNEKVTFAKVETLNADDQWHRRRSEKEWNTVEPMERGQAIYEIITSHSAYVVRGAEDEPQVTGSDESDELHPNGQTQQEPVKEHGVSDTATGVLQKALKVMGLDPAVHSEIICNAINKKLSRTGDRAIAKVADVHYAEVPRIAHWLKLVQSGENGLPPDWVGIVKPDKEYQKAQVGEEQAHA